MWSRGGGGRGGVQKRKKSCTLAAFEKKIPYLSRMSYPLPPHISNGAFQSEISAGTRFLRRLRAPTLVWPSLKQLIGGGQLIADINTKNLQKVNLTSTRLQCVRVCVNFPHTVVFCWLFEFFLYFVQNIGRNGRTFTHINEPLRWANQAWMCQGSGIIIEKTGDFGAAEWSKSSFRYLKRWILYHYRADSLSERINLSFQLNFK